MQKGLKLKQGLKTCPRSALPSEREDEAAAVKQDDEAACASVKAARRALLFLRRRRSHFRGIRQLLQPRVDAHGREAAAESESTR